MSSAICSVGGVDLVSRKKGGDSVQMINIAVKVCSRVLFVVGDQGVAAVKREHCRWDSNKVG